MDSNGGIYETLFNTVAEGFIVVDQKGEIQMINPRVLDLFGYKKEELIGQKIELLIPERFHKNHTHQRSGFSESPQKRSMGIGLDLWAKRKDGAEIPVEISLNHLKVDGKYLIMALITDISGRIKAQKALLETQKKLEELNADLEKKVEVRTHELQASQQLYKAIARNFPDGTINVFDKDLRYVFAEGKELYKYGITSNKLIGTHYIERLPKEIAKMVETHLLEVFKGESQSIEVNLNNTFYTIEAVPLPNLDKQIDQILVVEKNITKQKLAELEVKRALDKEKELNELKSRFVSMASHEFRTPLSTILSSVSLINKYKTTEQDPQRSKHVHRIKSSVSNLTSILNDFLSLDKLEQGKVECKISLFNVEEFTSEIIEDVKGILKAGQKIEFVHKGEKIVAADEQMVRNIIINLISNASKYSDKDKQIQLYTQYEQDELLIRVKDQGIGIPEADKEHMFERFFRAGNSTNIQGTGLGLNICKKYVDFMGGTIHFESIEGKGSIFTINLPQTNLKNQLV